MLSNRFLAIVVVVLVFLNACSDAPEKIWQRQYSESQTYVAAIADDASFSVVSTDGQNLILWHRNEADPRFEMQQEQNSTQQLRAIDISADNQVALAASQTNFAVWDLSNGELRGYWRIAQEDVDDPDFETKIEAVAAGRNGTVIALGINTGKVIVMNPNNGRRLEMYAHNAAITELAISPNGKYILSASDDGLLHLWNSDTAEIVRSFELPTSVRQVAMSNDGDWLFASDQRDQALIWSLQSGELQSRLQFNDRKRTFSAATFSPDGRYLLTGMPSRSIEIWRTDDGERVAYWRVSGNRKGRMNAATVLSIAVDNEHATIWTENSAGIAELWQWPSTD